MKKYRIFGAPGSGKTTWIVNKIGELVSKGVPLEKIMCLSFANQTVNEFKKRLSTSNTLEDSLKYFKTIHSICNKCRVDSKTILGKEHYKLFKGFDIEEVEKLYFIHNLKREKSNSLEEIDYNGYDLEDFESQLEGIKKRFNLLDFTDMLEDFNTSIKIDYLFVDEAQDLSYWQWKVIDKLMANCKEVYIVLDDCQAIFDWAGADVDYILKQKDYEDIVLPETFRLPSLIFSLSQEILKDLNVSRYENLRLNNKLRGNIECSYYINDIDFMEENSYLILVRNVYMYKKIEKFCKNKNFKVSIENIPLFSQSQVDAVKDYIENGKELTINLSKDDIDYIYQSYIKDTKSANINISTIHKAKGGECDNVVLFLEITKKQYDDLEENESKSELKVLYVGVTRAKKNLYIIDNGRYKYDISQYL